VSTIFGMMPVALSSGDGSEWRNPMGIISIGGLAASTMLTLLVVPVVYTLFDDAAAWLSRLLRLPHQRNAAARVQSC
jgi:HAE1 family hydrophobic/amphiphilic exporter-1